MKVVKKIIFLFLIQSLIEIKSTTIWTPQSLYEYAETNILKSYNSRYNFNINYMLIDPENHLSNADLSKIFNKMKNLYKDYKINSYIILISNFEFDKYKSDINEEVKKFTSYFNYILQKGNSLYNDSMALTTVFFLKNRKMRMRTGKLLRKILSDNTALKILNNRKSDLRNHNYYNVVDKLLDDIIFYYRFYSFFYKYLNQIIITFFIIIISIIYIIIRLCYVPENEREKKIKEFLENNRKKQINHIVNETCIICLDNLPTDNNETKDKKNSQTKEEKIAILDCGHRFHDKCIIEWLKKHDKCPLCRIKVKFDNNNNENQNNFSRNLEDDYNFIVDIQSDAYPDEINYRNRNRIISSFERTEKNSSSNNDTTYSSHDYGRDFSDFDSGSGGATSDW